jgi:repressor LexA
MADKLTKSQRRAWLYIARYVNEHQYPPGYREIAAGCGWGSNNTAHYHVDALVSKGYACREPNVARGLRLLRWPDVSELWTDDYRKKAI